MAAAGVGKGGGRWCPWIRGSGCCPVVLILVWKLENAAAGVAAAGAVTGRDGGP